MIRQNSFGRTRSVSRALAGRPRYAHVALEPLEQRQMLDAAYINEIYLDPPSGSDVINEYIELRGTPGMSLDNTYLLIIENENNSFNTGQTGEIEKIFDLSGQQMGSNGFLVLRQAGNPYTVAPGTTELFYTGTLENSGFTAMLIQTDGLPANVPALNFDLDAGNDGLDLPNGHAGWTILDAIGVHAEAGEALYGRLYGQINFGPEASTNIEPGATYVGVGYEIEYLGRWGNSTGQTEADWHVSNLTDNVLAGYTGTGDFRQSGDPQGEGAPGQIVETNKDVPYGTNLTNTLGAPNLVDPTEVYINEIYFDPPSGSDIINEYVELRGTPNMSLDDYFLIFVENENDIFNEGQAGYVERVFDLNGLTLGANGYLVMHQSGHPYTIAPGTTEIVYSGVIENSGFTAMLIKNNGGPSSAPFVSDITPMDLDEGNDGLDVASGHIDWDIKDSIGLHSEGDELEFGILYGAVNFGPGPNGVPIDNYYNVGFEIEYVGRWGNSTGSTDVDWHVSNLTDNLLSGYTGTGDFRQSADPHGSANVESNQGVPYGTNLTNTLGADNYPLVVAPPASIAGRHIFYNGSKYDGNSTAINASDDLAIAPDKSPYFPGGGIAPISSITSYSRGINGIMVDIDDAAGTLTLDDFSFKIGANNTPSTWANAPAPTGFTVRTGAGTGGSDRVEIVWANSAIQNTWLQVVVEGDDAAGGFNTNTGLTDSDIFYFGNRIGDTFVNSPATVVTTNVADEIAARQNPSFGVGITNAFDFDKNDLINVSDQITARLNVGFLTRISIGDPPAAPVAEPALASVGDDGTSAVASALALPSKVAKERIGQFLDVRRDAIQSHFGAIARVFAHLSETQPVRTAKLAAGIEQVAESLGVDDELIDSLLDEIGLG